MDIKERTVQSTVKLLEDNIIEFIAVTEKYVPKDIIPNLAAWGEKQPVIYRHEHPAKGWGGQILGRSISAKVVEYEDLTALKGKAKMFDNTDMQSMALEYIAKKQKEGEPIQISIGYQEFYKNGKIVDAQIYEYSLTHIPVCSECVVSIGELEMDETKLKELEDSVKVKEATIGELQNSLDKMSGKVKEFESQVADKDTKIKEYEEKYVAQKDEVSTLKTRVSELEETNRFSHLKGRVDSLVKLYEDPDLYGYFKEKALSKDGEAWLDKKLEDKKGKKHPVPETQSIKELEEEVTGKPTQTKITLLEQKEYILQKHKDDPKMQSIMLGLLNIK